MTSQTIAKSLFKYGYSTTLGTAFEPYAALGYTPVRIIQEGRSLSWATDGENTILLQYSGSYQNLIELGVQQPAVIGDWCAVHQYSEGRGRIEGVLPRNSEFHKPVLYEGPTTSGLAPVVAANIDYACIVQDACNDWNLHRLERFVSLLLAQDIPACIVLTKIDLAESIEEYTTSIQEHLPSIPVFLIDSLSGNGRNSLLAHMKPRTTYMLIGTSGAGKSTLINSLCNTEVAKTGQVRSQDGRGRHTTTARRIHLLSEGALLLDTPGVRVVGMNSNAAQVEDTFMDIVALAEHCRYSNCSHTGEPGCAIEEALRTGVLKEDRFRSFLQLRQEARTWEDVLTQRKQKEKALGKLQYSYRKESHR